MEMNYQELIEKYQSESITVAEERKLFRRLANDDILRSEMKQISALGISSAAVPSYAAKANLFQSVGFNYKENNVGLLSGYYFNKFKPYAVALICSVVAMLLTSAYYQNIASENGAGEFSTNSSAGEYVAMSDEKVNDEQGMLATDKISKTANKNNLSNNNKSGRLLSNKRDIFEDTAINNISVLQDTIQQNTEEIAENQLNSLPSNEQKISNNNSTLNNDEKVKDIVESTVIPEKTDSTFPIIENQTEYIDNSIKKISISVNASTFKHVNETDIMPSYISPLYNFSAFLFYKINKFQIGISARQEIFNLTYLNLEKLDTYEYNQSPNLLSFDFNLRYNYNLTPKFALYAQGSAGLNNYGYIARGALGLKYDITNRWAVELQPEYSTFFFVHENKNYTASKFGLTYGVSYAF